MHGPLRLPTRCPGLSGTCCLAIMCAVVLALFFSSSALIAQQSASAPVVAEMVRRDDVVVVDHTFVGTVIPTRTSVVGSPVEGRVVEFLVEEGDHVKQGAKLAQLRLTTLAIRLAGAQAELELLKSQLKDLEVAQPIQIKQAAARKMAAEALYKYANSQLQRSKTLRSSSQVSQSEFEQLQSSASSALKIIEERRAALDLAIETAPVKIAQARQRIRVQEEIIRGFKDAIEEHTVRAPFDGYVAKEYTEVGQWITKGGPVVELVELKEVEIRLPVLETYVSNLRARVGTELGTKTLELTVDALPGQQFTGDVVAIVPKADNQSRTFPVNIRVENRTGPDMGTVLLKPGMFARVKLPVRTVRGAVMIPTDALVLAGKMPTVFVVVPGAESKQTSARRVRSVAVDVASSVSVGNWVQVTGPIGADGSLPLKPGEWVVTEGNERINPRMTVTVTKRGSK